MQKGFFTFFLLLLSFWGKSQIIWEITFLSEEKKRPIIGLVVFSTELKKEYSTNHKGTIKVNP